MKIANSCYQLVSSYFNEEHLKTPSYMEFFDGTDEKRAAALPYQTGWTFHTNSGNDK
jgi:hypothetical protein